MANYSCKIVSRQIHLHGLSHGTVGWGMCRLSAEIGACSLWYWLNYEQKHWICNTTLRSQFVDRCKRINFGAGLSHSTFVWGIFWFVRATIGECGSWYRESSVFELQIWLNDCSTIVTSIILLESVFWQNLGVGAIGETLKQNQPTLAQQKIPPPCPSDEQILDSRV